MYSQPPPPAPPPAICRLLLVQVYAAMLSTGLSACLCYLGSQLSAAWCMPSQSITIITALTLLLASTIPKALEPLAPSAEGLALMLMQVGGQGSRQAPSGGGWPGSGAAAGAEGVVQSHTSQGRVCGTGRAAQRQLPPKAVPDGAHTLS